MPTVNFPNTISTAGDVDETVNVESFISSLADNTTVMLPDGGIVAIDGTVDITKIGLTLWGKGSGCQFKTLTDGSSSSNPLQRKMFKFLNGANINLYNITTIGGNPFAGTGDAAYDINKESQHLLEFRGTQGVLIDRWTGSDCYGDFLYLGDNSAPDYTPTRDVTVRNFTLQRNGRQGFGITGAERVQISRGYIGDCRRAVLDIEPNNALGVIRNLSMDHLTIGPHRLLLWSNVGAGDAVIEDISVNFNLLVGETSPDFAVARLAVTCQTTTGTAGQFRRRFKLNYNRTANQHGGPGGYIVYFEGIDDVEVLGNIQPIEIRTPNQHLVNIVACSNVRVRENTLLNAYAALRIGSNGNGSSNYCALNNLVGNPLRLEVPDFPCGS